MTSFVIMQISQQEFDKICNENDNQGKGIQAIPQYFAVDYRGEINIYPYLPNNKKIKRIIIDLEDKDETKR